MAHERFRSLAPQIMRNIIRDLDVTTEDAAAILGNFGVETGGFTLRLEKGKTTYDSTGYGWAQWTGSRRRDFDAWCRANGLSQVPADPAGVSESLYHDACYRFFKHEVTKTWEKRAIPALKAAVGIETKTLSFMKLYERPGVPHQDRRIEVARIALAAYRDAHDDNDEIETKPGKVPDTPGATVATPSVGGIVPASWLTPAAMQRIIVHWTSGRHKANATDRSHYHVLIEGDGTVIRGTHEISDNTNTGDGDYAAHTRGTNTGSIGVSMCAMMGAKESPFDPGPAPVTKAQWDKMVQVCAVLARTYKIPVTNKTILTHAEVQSNLGIQQSGKWDVTRIAFDHPKSIGAKACGDRMRNEIRAAISGATTAPPTLPKGTGTGTIGTVVVGGGAAAAKKVGFDWGVIIPIAIIAIAAVVAAVFIVRKRSN